MAWFLVESGAADRKVMCLALHTTTSFPLCSVSDMGIVALLLVLRACLPSVFELTKDAMSHASVGCELRLAHAIRTSAQTQTRCLLTCHIRSLCDVGADCAAVKILVKRMPL